MWSQLISQRNTVQRQIILDALRNLKTHPAIDEIYAEIHKEHPSISKTTVYRNLRKIANDGLIRKVSLPDGLERYDGCIDPHYHFKCKECGGIFDVNIQYLTDINDMVHAKHGFSVDEHDMVFSGLCVKCKLKKK